MKNKINLKSYDNQIVISYFVIIFFLVGQELAITVLP